MYATVIGSSESEQGPRLVSKPAPNTMVTVRGPGAEREF